MTQIIKAPHPILRTPAKPVDKIDKKIITIIDNMYKTLLAQKDPEGVGIAAPQIGVSLRMFFTRPTPKDKPQLFINPEITNLSRDQVNPKSKNALLEGCLSLPKYYGHINRSKHITIKYKFLNLQFPISNIDWSLDPDRFMTEKEETFSGFPAQIIQHEFDHLNGTLFIDRILEQKGTLYQIDGDQWHKVDL